MLCDDYFFEFVGDWIFIVDEDVFGDLLGDCWVVFGVLVWVEFYCIVDYCVGKVGIVDVVVILESFVFGC